MGLKIWMRAVGVLYLVLALPNLLLLVDPAGGLALKYPDLGLAPFSPVGRELGETWAMYGLDLAVIGVALLVFSRRPAAHVGLIWTVIGLDVVRGVADDIYDLARGGSVAFYVAFIVLHLAVVVTGVMLLRRRSSARGGVIDETAVA